MPRPATAQMIKEMEKMMRCMERVVDQAKILADQAKILADLEARAEVVTEEADEPVQFKAGTWGAGVSAQREQGEEAVGKIFCM